MLERIKTYHFFSELIALPFVDAIYLFGSRATGRHRDRSDIDLAIQCPKASNEEWYRVLSIIEDADTLLKIDCVRLDQLNDDALRNNIQREHIILYERKS